MKTIEDLSFLKAQAADLERLIRIAPPSAVIAKYQYEERLSDVRETITSLEEAVQQDCEPTNSCSEIDDSIQMNYARRVLKACQLATRLLRRSLISESEPLHIPSIANHLENQKFS